MAKKLLIVHGYSDGSGSFEELGDWFVEQGVYKKESIFYADYASMDDQATFRDFADKLDEDYSKRFCPGGVKERIDVACHSTGALVVRAWLVVHYERHHRRRLDLTCPIHHLLMFAPANFGSDLAGMGQSFLGKARTTFFNSHSHREDFMESGKQVLEGLEPASPFQWELSDYDLHGDRVVDKEKQDRSVHRDRNGLSYDGSGYFDPRRLPHERCYPFVFAAGKDYTGTFQARIIKKRKKPGTDGTVRICGTSLNTRKCTIDFRDPGKGGKNNTRLVWWNEAQPGSIGTPKKYAEIPFCVFPFNHGGIVHPDKDPVSRKAFGAPTGPGTLAVEALKVDSLKAYRRVAELFAKASSENYKNLPKRKRGVYQQFFFRVTDDVDLEVQDFYADFFVLDRNEKPHDKLTRRWDEDFESHFYRHSANPACRVLMVDLSDLRDFLGELKAEKAKLAFEISAKSSVPNVTYQKGYYLVYDGASAENPGVNFIRPNTTTLVRAVVNRRQAGKLLNLKDSSFKRLIEDE